MKIIYSISIFILSTGFLMAGDFRPQVEEVYTRFKTFEQSYNFSTGSEQSRCNLAQEFVTSFNKINTPTLRTSTPNQNPVVRDASHALRICIKKASTFVSGLEEELKKSPGNQHRLNILSILNSADFNAAENESYEEKCLEMCQDGTNKTRLDLPVDVTAYLVYVASQKLKSPTFQTVESKSWNDNINVLEAAAKQLSTFYEKHKDNNGIIVENSFNLRASYNLMVLRLVAFTRDTEVAYNQALENNEKQSAGTCLSMYKVLEPFIKLKNQYVDPSIKKTIAQKGTLDLPTLSAVVGCDIRMPIHPVASPVTAVVTKEIKNVSEAVRSPNSTTPVDYDKVNFLLDGFTYYKSTVQSCNSWDTLKAFFASNGNYVRYCAWWQTLTPYTLVPAVALIFAGKKVI